MVLRKHSDSAVVSLLWLIQTGRGGRGGGEEGCEGDFSQRLEEGDGGEGQSDVAGGGVSVVVEGEELEEPDSPVLHVVHQGEGRAPDEEGVVGQVDQSLEGQTSPGQLHRGVGVVGRGALVLHPGEGVGGLALQEARHLNGSPDHQSLDAGV